jgi:hypothetical protein
VTHLFGQFDFNRTPLAPPGTRVVAHFKPKARRTWAPRGEEAWYVGAAKDHYICYRFWMTGTNKKRIVDTLEFFPQHVKMPHLSTYELAIQAACELTFALHNPAPEAPFAHIVHKQHEALHRLAKFFKEIAAPEPQQATTELPTESPSGAPSPGMPPTEVPTIGSRTRDRSKVKPGFVRKDIRSSGSDNLQQGKEDVFTNSDQPRGKTKKSSLLHLTSTE